MTVGVRNRGESWQATHNKSSKARVCLLSQDDEVVAVGAGVELVRSRDMWCVIAGFLKDHHGVAIEGVVVTRVPDRYYPSGHVLERCAPNGLGAEAQARLCQQQVVMCWRAGLRHDSHGSERRVQHQMPRTNGGRSATIPNLPHLISAVPLRGK